MLVSGDCGTFLVGVRQTLACKTRDLHHLLCLVLQHTRAVNVVNNRLSTLRNARSQVPMTNAVDPIASIARLKLRSPILPSAQSPAHMTHMTLIPRRAPAHQSSDSKPDIFFSQRRPQLSPPSQQANIPQEELSRSNLNWSRNGHSLLHCSFVHSPPSLRTTGPDHGQG